MMLEYLGRKKDALLLEKALRQALEKELKDLERKGLKEEAQEIRELFKKQAELKIWSSQPKSPRP
jgi:isocitrate/isopropylmalate dehydrogenase